MNAVVAIDSLKGSLTSMEAGRAVCEGIRRVYPDAVVSVRPLADGGEGTVEALVSGMNGELRTITVTGPLGQPPRLNPADAHHTVNILLVDFLVRMCR